MMWSAEGFDLRTGPDGEMWMWPSTDEGAWAATHATLPDLQRAIDFCGKRDIAIQAGGNCGVWPKYLAKNFRNVYTFEPDNKNFQALVNNVPEQNVYKMQAFLGDVRKAQGIAEYSKDNCGAFYALTDGNVPTIRLDDHYFGPVDLIALDVEGKEPEVILGASDLINFYKPVIIFEDKHLERYGNPAGYTEKLLIDRGYKVAARVHRDIIMVPK